MIIFFSKREDETNTRGDAVLIFFTWSSWGLEEWNEIGEREWTWNELGYVSLVLFVSRYPMKGTERRNSYVSSRDQRRNTYVIGPWLVERFLTCWFWLPFVKAGTKESRSVKITLLLVHDRGTIVQWYLPYLVPKYEKIRRRTPSAPRKHTTTAQHIKIY